MRFFTQETYQRHLESDYWRIDVHRAVRNRVLDHHGCICCERCQNDRGPFEKHHLHYRSFGRELYDLKSLWWLCVPCHRELHRR